MPASQRNLDCDQQQKWPLYKYSVHQGRALKHHLDMLSGDSAVEQSST